MSYKKLLLGLLLIQNTYAATPFDFLCGSDEDGCIEGQEQYCACIPVSVNQNQPYCLDLDNQSCKPVTEQPDCSQKYIVVENQGVCLTTLFQSEGSPLCKIVPQSFCDTHPVYKCDETGSGCSK
jgi:hypothetical protein